MKLTGITKRVEAILRLNPSSRDSDNKLISNIWYDDLKKKGIDPNKITGMAFMKIYSEGQLSNAESIRRSRQKLQQEYPEQYLGSILPKDKKRLQNDVKNQLKDI